MAKMPDKVNKLSDGEVAILSVLWDAGELTATEIWERLMRAGPVDRTSVATRVRRMVDGGLLRPVADCYPARYSAAVARKAALEWSLRDLIGRFFGGTHRPALDTFIAENTSLSEQEKKDLQSELAKFDEPAARKSARRSRR